MDWMRGDRSRQGERRCPVVANETVGQNGERQRDRAHERHRDQLHP
jgi:hypothetical protein